MRALVMQRGELWLDDLEPPAPGPDQVLVWWSYGTLEVIGLLMQSQHFFDILTEDERNLGAFLDGPPGSQIERDGRRLKLELEDSGLRGLDPATILRLEVGSEWKIRDLVYPEREAKPPV